MVINKFAPQFIALVILSSSLPCTKLHAANENASWIVGGVTAACLLGVTYTYKCAKTETARIKEAEDKARKIAQTKAKAEADRAQALKEALARPASITNRHTPLINILAYDPTAAQNPRQLSEQFLIEHAQDLTSSCLLSSDIDGLSIALETINEAINRSCDSGELQRLHSAAQQQTELLEQLKKARLCCESYAAYINLCQRQATLAEKHARTIKLLASHPELQKNPQATISPALKPLFNTALSIQHASSEKSRVYPYVSYVHESSIAIKEADEIVKQASNLYPKLALQAQDVSDKITALHHVARNSTEYQNDRIAYEKDQKEQQEFRLKQEHCAQLEQIQRAAAEEHAEIQRKILKTAEDRLKTEQERLQEQRDQGNIKRSRLKIAQELSDQVKATAASQALLQQTVHGRMATVEAQQKTAETKHAAIEHATQRKLEYLDAALQAIRQDIERLKANVTQLYTAQNNQENKSKDHEARVTKLETNTKKLADQVGSLQSVTQKKQTPITEEPIGPKIEQPEGPGAA